MAADKLKLHSCVCVCPRVCACTVCVRLSFESGPLDCGSSYYNLAATGARNTGG